MYTIIKKYIFLLSLFLFIVTGAHLAILYLYEDSSTEPLSGGTLSVGFVSSVPTLNPLFYKTESTNDLISRFLYRSVLKYNIYLNKLEGDLMFCDVSSLEKISCSLRTQDPYFWSNGDIVTLEDIKKSYDFYKTYSKDPVIKSILEILEISQEGDRLIFSFKIKDREYMKIFMLPILKSDQIDSFNSNTGDFWKSFFSGPYKFLGVDYDSEYRVNRITLEKNIFYPSDENYIDRYIFKFFPSMEDMQNALDTLHVIYTSDTPIEMNSLRFEPYSFERAKKTSLFLNSETVEDSLREKIMSDIFLPISEWREISENTWIQEELKKLGYISGQKMSDERDILLTHKEEQENIFNKEEELIPHSSVIVDPTKKSIFFTTDPIVLFSGNVPENTQKVRINDYTLQSFSKGSSTFFYRTNPIFSNIQEGKNIYEIYINDQEELLDTFTIYYYPDTDILQEEKRKVLQSLEDALPVEENQESENEEAPIDVHYFYNPETGIPKTIRFMYPDNTLFLEKIVSDIISNLESLGIQVVSFPVANTYLQEILSQWEKEYDIILANIGLGITGYNLFPYFHSGQAQKGFNFSKIRDIELDILLEKIRQKNIIDDDFMETYNEILSKIKEKYIYINMYTPKFYFYIDKNIFQINTSTNINSPIYIYDLLEKSYIRTEHILDTDKKNIRDFFHWLFETFSWNRW